MTPDTNELATRLRNRVMSEIASRTPDAFKRTRERGAVKALRDTWSRYPSEWKTDPGLNLGAITLGDEWGGPEFADFIVDLVAPYLSPDADVVELGCGGGKFSQRLAPRCRSLQCTDISPTMIEHTRESLLRRGVGANVSYRVLNGSNFDGVASESADFIFSYDVQLHLQMQNVFSYMLDARRVLRDGGVFMLHQINLASAGGAAHFQSQYGGDTWKHDFDDPRRRGHIYFMSEGQMRELANQAGLAMQRIVSDSRDFAYVTGDRDLIGFLQKRPSRLELNDPTSVPLLRQKDHPAVYAVVDGHRLAVVSPFQFERAGFRWEDVREVADAELAAIPDSGPLEPWE
jgi:2-polyprenyl-3-methyl-5-hydroxy-6-metoxy-1,4-benzoquinol methylase